MLANDWQDDDEDGPPETPPLSDEEMEHLHALHTARNSGASMAGTTEAPEAA